MGGGWWGEAGGRGVIRDPGYDWAWGSGVVVLEVSAVRLIDGGEHNMGSTTAIDHDVCSKF